MDHEETANHPEHTEGMDNEDVMPAPMPDEIEKWTLELTDIEDKLALLNERKALLQQVLETMPAVEKLRGNAPLVTEPSEKEASVILDNSPKLVNAIPMVLHKYRKAMTPAQIREHLKDVGFIREFGETYFYTAVKRAVEKKTIAKRRDGRYSAVMPTNGANIPGGLN